MGEMNLPGFIFRLRVSSTRRRLQTGGLGGDSLVANDKEKQK
jgi:hypothetical protein